MLQCCLAGSGAGGGHSCSEFMSEVVPSCPKDTVFSWSSLTSGSYGLSIPFLVMFPGPCGRVYLVSQFEGAIQIMVGKL